MGKVLASADIGSNTVHLLIADSDGTGLQRIVNQSEWLSLGEAVARTGSVPPEKVAILMAVLRDYKQESLNIRAQRFFVFATEAMRAANNGPELLNRIETELDLDVRLISPKQEAELSLNGISLDCSLPEDCLLFEIGGGSAQIAHCRGRQIEEEVSLQLGTGKLIAEANISNPATPASLAKASVFIEKQLAKIGFEAHGLPVFASGGVARGLIRALHPDGDQELRIEELEFAIWSTARLSQSRIVQRYGVKPKRAAAMLPGALVYQALLQKFGANSMRVSEYGVREGAILLMARAEGPAWLG